MKKVSIWFQMNQVNAFDRLFANWFVSVKEKETLTGLLLTSGALTFPIALVCISNPSFEKEGVTVLLIVQGRKQRKTDEVPCSRSQSPQQAELGLDSKSGCFTLVAHLRHIRRL